MLRDIMRKSNLIQEASEIKKGFKFFMVDEIKDQDLINDMDDLGDRKNLEVVLITDENYDPDNYDYNEYFKIDTEKLIKYVEEKFPKYESGDYMDFTGNFSLHSLVCEFIAQEYESKCFGDWEEFSSTMDGHTKVAAVPGEKLDETE